MLKYKLGDHSFELPVSWDEVTLKQFKAIMSPKKVGDITEVISILSGLDYDLLSTTVRPMEENQRLIEAVGWAAVLPDWFNTPLPKEFYVSGKKIDLNKDIKSMAFGQYGAFVSLAAENPMVWKDKLYININKIDTAIAIYCYSDWSGEAWSDKCMSMIPEIEKLPFLECFAVASFFLNKFSKSEKSNPKSLPINPPRTRSRQVSKTSTSSGL